MGKSNSWSIFGITFDFQYNYSELGGNQFDFCVYSDQCGATVMAGYANNYGWRLFGDF